MTGAVRPVRLVGPVRQVGQLPELVDFGHVGEAGGGKFRFDSGAVLTERGAEIVEVSVIVAEFHVDCAEKHEWVLGKHVRF